MSYQSPILSLNGSDPDQLIDALKEARDAIWKAIKAFNRVEPHGRDYQPDPSAYQVARKQYKEQLEALTQADIYLADIMTQVQDQVDERATNKARRQASSYDRR